MLEGKYSRIKLQNTFSRPFILHKIINFQTNQNLVFYLRKLSLYCELCFHKRSLLVLDSDSCLRELHREPRTIFMESHRNTFNYELGQLGLNFTMNYVY